MSTKAPNPYVLTSNRRHWQPWMGLGSSARWSLPRSRRRGRSGSAAATAAAAVAGGDDCGVAAASARTAAGGAPPTSAGAGGCTAVAAPARRVRSSWGSRRGRSSWGSHRGRCPCPEGTWRADPSTAGGLSDLLRNLREDAGIKGKLTDRNGKRIWAVESLGAWRLDPEQNRTPFSPFGDPLG
jgi:hypothetical protein